MSGLKELASKEVNVLGDLKNFNVVQTVVGSAIGFVVWFVLTKATKPIPDPKPDPIVPTPTAQPAVLVIKDPDDCKDPIINPTKSISNDQVQSFW